MTVGCSAAGKCLYQDFLIGNVTLENFAKHLRSQLLENLRGLRFFPHKKKSGAPQMQQKLRSQVFAKSIFEIFEMALQPYSSVTLSHLQGSSVTLSPEGSCYADTR